MYRTRFRDWVIIVRPFVGENKKKSIRFIVHVYCNSNEINVLNMIHATIYIDLLFAEMA